jgi:hypothetical protein
VFLAWTANPLFNVLLRFDPLGRLALTKRQWVATNYMVFCLLGVCAGLAAWLVTRSEAALLTLIFSAFMMIPIAGACESNGQKRRMFLGIYAAALGSLAVLTVAATALRLYGSADSVLSVLLIGFVAFTWISNFVPDR